MYAHVYYSHFARIRELQEEAHLNTAFKHFILFVWEFDLISKEELSPLTDLLINLMGERALEKLGPVGGTSPPPASAPQATSSEMKATR